MENGFSSPRSEVFPAGLRVLVVDDDPTWLKILEKMLKKCSYEVTTCGLATEALRLLRERKDGFDIVVSDVNMPDMDGFKLLELVGLEMDLPVIMMSVDGETSRVMKGVQHGACDYLLKPIRMKELRNIWQHVFRKKIHEIRDIESHDCIEGMFMRNSSDHSDDGIMLSVEELSCVRKRKDMDNKHDDKDYSDASSSKKARVVWSVDLHQKFVKAVNQIGFHKVGPKKILDLMNVPWLTRENVASHLQKYRLYLSRLQKEKENDTKSSFIGLKHTDAPLKEPPPASFVVQNSTSILRNDVSEGSFQFPVDGLLPQGPDESSLEEDLRGVASEPVTEKSKSTQTGFNRCFKPLESDAIFEPFGSNIPAKYSWNEALEHKPLLHSENSFNKIPLPDPTSISSISSKPSTAEMEPSVSIKRTEPNYQEYSHIDSLPVAAKCHMANHHVLEPIYTTTSSVAVPASHLDCAADILEASQRGLIFGDDLQAFLQGDYNGDLLGVRSAGYLDYADPWLANDVPLHLYDSLRFGFEYPYDPTEFAIVDQSLLT